MAPSNYRASTAPTEHVATGTDGNVVSFSGRISSPIGGKSESQNDALNKPAKPAKQKTSVANPTSRKPPNKRRKKPYHPRGYYWRENGAGFDLRRSRDDGYVAHLGRTEFNKLKRQYKGKQLEDALREWIKKRESK
jgi:hypothetical protein